MSKSKDRYGTTTTIPLMHITQELSIVLGYSVRILGLGLGLELAIGGPSLIAMTALRYGGPKPTGQCLD